MTNNEKQREIAREEIKFAMHSYVNKDKSLDKCVMQKYAKSAFKGLRNGRPPGMVDR